MATGPEGHVNRTGRIPSALHDAEKVALLTRPPRRTKGSVSRRPSLYCCLVEFLQSVRSRQLTNLIAPINIGGGSQVSLTDAIRHLFEFGDRSADAASN